ncbi:MAG: DUF305 domain-containing protein [Balneolaceae bacterium]|nr:DUF305 domain-containing protein [Balneolaceae bacterium]MDR9447492.1 DUF305 domain-containing protein [Balneolaceae bacterium]
MKIKFLIATLAAVLLCSSHSFAQDTRDLSPAELEKLYWDRIEEKLSIYTDADVKFMEDMIIHHSQALVMSRFAPINGASEEVQVLAARIINAQLDEIKIMQRWLLDRGLDAPSVEYDGIESVITMLQPAKENDGGHMSDPSMDKEDAMMMRGDMDMEGMDHEGEDHSEHEGMDHDNMDHSMHMDHSDMVGMLSMEQLAELRDAEGPLFDELYLEYMIQHHNGAVVMVEELFSYDGAAQGVQTYKLASDIQVDQRSEIARMQRMLNERIVSSVEE